MGLELDVSCCWSCFSSAGTIPPGGTLENADRCSSLCSNDEALLEVRSLMVAFTVTVVEEDDAAADDAAGGWSRESSARAGCCGDRRSSSWRRGMDASS